MTTDFSGEVPNELLGTNQLCAYDNWEMITDVSRSTAARKSILHSFYVEETFRLQNWPIYRARDVDAIPEQGKLGLDQ